MVGSIGRRPPATKTEQVQNSRPFGELAVEAMWIAALIVAPLLFSPGSTQPFEQLNTALVRTLGMASLLIVAVRASANQHTRIRRLFRDPITLTSLGILGAYGLSTFFSVSPSISVMGTPERQQGLYTTLAVLALFWTMISTITRRGQLRRVFDVISMVAFVVASYAIVQHHGLDPIELATAWKSTRVSSSLGNPIFLGGFLILIIPFTLTRILSTFPEIMSNRPPTQRGVILAGFGCSIVLFAWNWVGGPSVTVGELLLGWITDPSAAQFIGAILVAFILLAIYAGLATRNRSFAILELGADALLLATMVLALLLTSSRGPILGIVAGVSSMALAYTAVYRKGKLLLIALILALLGLTVLSGVYLADQAGIVEVCQDPYVGRVACPISGPRFEREARLYIWRGTVDLWLVTEPLISPLTGSDQWNTLRPLIGYGPETFLALFPLTAPPDLNQILSAGVRVDRAHNSLLDALTETGLLGVGIRLLLFLLVTRRAMSMMGL